MATNPPTSKSPASGRVPAWVWPVVIAGVVLVVALVLVTVVTLMPTPPQTNSAAQSPAKPPQQQSQPEPQPTTPEPAPEPAPSAPVAIPSCEELLPESYARSASLAAARGPDGLRWGDVGFDRFSQHFGPATQAALSGTVQSRGCSYPTNLESAISLYVMELPEPTKASFVSALRSDPDFVESTDGSTLMFVWKDSSFDPYADARYTAHIFVGDVWIASYSPSLPEIHTPTATAAVRAANPQLQ